MRCPVCGSEMKFIKELKVINKDGKFTSSLYQYKCDACGSQCANDVANLMTYRQVAERIKEKIDEYWYDDIKERGSLVESFHPVYVEAMDKIKNIVDKGYDIMFTTHTKNEKDWDSFSGSDDMFSMVQIFQIDNDFDSAWKTNIHNFKGKDFEEALDKTIKFIEDKEKRIKEEAKQDLYAED